MAQLRALVAHCWADRTTCARHFLASCVPHTPQRGGQVSCSTLQSPHIGRTRRLADSLRQTPCFGAIADLVQVAFFFEGKVACAREAPLASRAGSPCMQFGEPFAATSPQHRQKETWTESLHTTPCQDSPLLLCRPSQRDSRHRLRGLAIAGQRRARLGNLPALRVLHPRGLCSGARVHVLPHGPHHNEVEAHTGTQICQRQAEGVSESGPPAAARRLPASRRAVSRMS